MTMLVLIAGAFCFFGWKHWEELDYKSETWKSLLREWAIKGLAFPAVVWALVNLGLTRKFPPFVPRIAEAQAHSWPWFVFWMEAVILGAATVGFCWAAITYTWMFGVIVARSREKLELGLTAALIGLVSGAVGTIMVYYFGLKTAPAAVTIFLLPIVHCTIHHAEVFVPTPGYSKAMARIKFGKYAEAEWAVIEELEKSEKDFEGWILLAELYATQYRRMTDTAQVILDICNDPNTQPVQISVACHKLADWQLQIWENPDGARNALEMLCRKLPETHFAKMARQRMATLPHDEKELEERKKPKLVRLPSLREEYKPSAAARDATAKSTAKADAERLVEKLTADPNDFAARERLAAILAEELNQPDLAIEQLNLLVELADPSDEQKGKWLAQVAAWELYLKNNPQRFRAVLKQIIAEYPQTSHAFAAQRRLYLLDIDAALLDKPV